MRTRQVTGAQASRQYERARRDGRVITSGRHPDGALIAERTSRASTKATGRDTHWAADGRGTYAVWYVR